MRKLFELLIALFGGKKKKCHPEYKGKGNHPDFPDDRPVHGYEGRFDHHWYLEHYPDVRNSKCYKHKPYAHYMKYGRKEGRHKYSDKPSGAVHTVVKSNQPIFSLKKVNGRILSGTYSWPSSNAKVYDGSHRVLDINCGESVFDIVKYGDKIFYSTEDRGKVFSTDLHYGHLKQELKLRGTDRLHGTFGCSVVFGKLVFISSGEIFVYGIGSVKRFNDKYVKSIFEYKGTAYVPGYDHESNRAGWYSSRDLRSWTWTAGPKGYRFIRGIAASDRVYIVGSANYNGGKHHADSAAVFATKDMKSISLIKKFNGFKYISHGAYSESTLYVGVEKGFRSHSTGVQLIKFNKGKWSVVATFPYAEIRGIVVDGSIYVACGLHGTGGAVFKIGEASHSTGNVEAGSFRGFHYDNARGKYLKSVFRFSHPGSWYPKHTKLVWYEGADMHKMEKIIDPSKKVVAYGPEGVHVNPASDAQTAEWNGKVAIMLPYDSMIAYKKMGLRPKVDFKGCTLEW